MKYFKEIKREDYRDLSLLIATPVGSDGLIHHQYQEGIWKALYPDYTDIRFKTGHFIDQARNELVEIALKQPYDYIMFIDSDIKINRSTIVRMLVRGAETGIPIQAGIYMSKRPPYRWQVYDWMSTGDMLPMINNSQDLNSVLGTSFIAGAAGAGCMLVEVEVFRRLDKPWFKTSYDYSGRFISEDISFFMNVREWGHDLFIDGEVVTHCRGLDQYPDIFREGWLREGTKSQQIRQSESLLYKNAMSLE